MPQIDRPLRILGVLDPRWRATYVDADETTATEADPRPGTATTTEPIARLDPAVVGAQSQAATLAVLQAGYPTPGGGGLGWGYYLEGETIDDARSYHPPTTITDYRTWMTPSGGDPKCDAALDDVTGRIALLMGTTASTQLGVYNPWTNTIAIPATTPGLGQAAAITYEPGTSRLYSVAPATIYVSEDHGATWSTVTDDAALYASFPGTPTFPATKQYRTAFDYAGALVWSGIDTAPAPDVLRLAASPDLGRTWAATGAVSDVFDADLSRHPDGWLGLVTSEQVSGSWSVRFRRLGSAWDDPATATVVDILTGAATSTRVGLGIDTNGSLWVYFSNATDTTFVRYSADNGETWTAAAPLLRWPSGHWRLVPHPHGGLAGAANDASVYHAGYFRLGGLFSPGRENDWADAAGAREDFHYTGRYLPTALLVGTTRVGTATETAVTAGGTAPFGYLRLQSTGAGLEGHYTYDVYIGDENEASAEFCVRVADDGGTTDSTPNGQGIGLELRARNSSAVWRLTVWLDEGGYRTRDEEGAAWLHDKVALDLTTRAHFRVSFRGATGYVCHRRDGDTRWTVTSWTTQASSAAVASNVRVDWGQLTAGVADTDHHWWYVRARGVHAPLLEGTDAVGVGAPRYYLPDLHDSTRERLALARVRGGPSLPGELYSLPVAPSYPVEAVLPTEEPSPDRRWRSTSTGATQRIVLDYGVDTDPAAGAGGLAFAVRRANVRLIKLRAAVDAASPTYTTVATVDLAEGFTGLTGALVGDTLAPTTGTASGSRYVRRGELRGGHVVYDVDGSAGGPYVREIRDNSAGWWALTGGPRVVVYLDGVTGAEPASADCYVAWPSGVVLVQGAPGTELRYRWWCVQIDSTEVAPDAYYEIGAAYLFGVVPLGKEWGSGYEWGRAPNVSTSVDAYGTDRRTQLGPSRRSLSLTWDDGQREDRFVSGSAATADYLASTTGESRVARDDVRGQVEGLLETAEGGALPVLVLLGEHSTESADTITDPTRYLIGYVDGEIRAQQGGRYDPDTGEFMRVGPVLIVESV